LVIFVTKKCQLRLLASTGLVAAVLLCVVPVAAQTDEVTSPACDVDDNLAPSLGDAGVEMISAPCDTPGAPVASPNW
jgi:hypothetical protein